MTQSPQLAAKDVLAKNSKTFSLAALLLPADVRTDAAVLYAYCRMVDDAVDLAATPEEAKAALAKQRADLDALLVDAALYPSTSLRVTSPLMAALADVLHRRRIPGRYLHELLDGMEMDVVGARYETLDELLLYCYRAAGTVGLMMAHLLGVSRPEALREACHLGIAMQFTNIARDVREDAERGRSYIPRRLVNEVGLRDAVASLLRTADRYYESADLGAASLQWRCQLAIRAARHLYCGIGRVIAAWKYDVMRGRARVGAWAKARLLVRACVETLRSVVAERRPFRAAVLPELVERHDCIRL